jgi:hypothetical protein
MKIKQAVTVRFQSHNPAIEYVEFPIVINKSVKRDQMDDHISNMLFFIHNHRPSFTIIKVSKCSIP